MSRTDLGERPAHGADAPRRSATPSDTEKAVAPAPVWLGVAVGLLAGGAGLAVGELIAGFSRSLSSPVVSVAERVRDFAPEWLVDFAKRNFSTGDKGVAIWTIVVVIALIAAAVGVATMRGHRRVGLVFAAVLGVLGAWSALASTGSGFGSIFPALLAAATAAGVLVWAGRHAAPARTAVEGRRPEMDAVDRRRFLMQGGLVAGAAVVLAAMGRSLQGRFNTQRERDAVALPSNQPKLPPPPADPAADPANDGLSPLFTPNKSFYRIDTAFEFPQIDLGSWELKVTGMVDTPIRLDFDGLSARDLFEQDITLSCVSNEVGGDLVGNARWIGCRLDDLLREAGIQADADQVLGISVDGFTAGFPVGALDGRDAMVAIGMNGEPLPVAHGFPARIVVPGLYGYVSAVKWLSEIKLTRFDQDEGYWIPRGWAALGPIKTQSRIDTPRRSIEAGTHAIGGVAWAPTRGIEQVEVQIDDGPWQVATLGPALNDLTWRQWWLRWDATPGKHTLRCRATDGDGETQPEERTDVAPDGATGWHSVRVTVK